MKIQSSLNVAFPQADVNINI